jgi:protein-S-isoprenylcysteine O-methyltransferase Ste14
MDADNTFRLILAAAIAGLLPIGIYHRLRSAATGEKLDRRQEGWFILIALRLIGWSTMLCIGAYVLNPPWMEWAAVPLPLWLRWVGVGLLPVTGFLVTWTFRHLGKNLTDTVVTRQEHTLVTTGPYRWVRHPFYVSGGLGIAAISLVTANACIAAGGLAVLILLAIRTRKEEQKLIERFGDEYRQYMRRTGPFFPRLRASP